MSWRLILVFVAASLAISVDLFAQTSLPPGMRQFPVLLRANITAITTDRGGNVYAAGFINSPELPVTPLAYQRELMGGICVGRQSTFPCNDAFVVKYNPDGRIVFATYLGGHGDDVASSIAIDPEGNVYVSGYTASNDFPVTNNTLPGTREQGTFIAKFNASGSTLGYALVLPGNQAPSAIAVDSLGQAVVAGITTDSQFPVTTGALQSRRGGGEEADGFLLKINSRGTGLVYATYLGGSRAEDITGLALDETGNAYVAGATASRDFPFTRGALDTVPVGKAANFWDAFVAKVNPSGTQLVYAARVTGSCNDRPSAIAVDASGRAHFTGSTCSRDFPTTANAVMRDLGSPVNSAFASALTTDGAALHYSTFLGGSTASGGKAIAFDTSGNPVISGWTLDWNLPTTPHAPLRCNPDTTPDPRQRTLQGFVARLNPQASAILYGSYFSAPASGATAVAAGASGRLFAAGRFADTGAVISEFDTLQPTQQQRVDCVSHGASFVPGRISPGQIVTIFGSQLGPREGIVPPLHANGQIPVSAGGTRVLIDGVPAPILFTRSDQVNAVVPFGLATRRNATVIVEFNGRQTAPQTVAAFDAVPDFFTIGSTGPAAALNQDGTVNTAANPAPKGSIVALFLTGTGPLNPAPADGTVSSPPVSALVLPAGVAIAGQRSEILYAGPAPGLIAGVTQINARVPSNLLVSNQPVELQVTAGTNLSLARATVFVQ